MDLFPFLYTGVDTMNTKRTDYFPSKIQLIFSVVATFDTLSPPLTHGRPGPFVVDEQVKWRVPAMVATTKVQAGTEGTTCRPGTAAGARSEP